MRKIFPLIFLLALSSCSFTETHGQADGQLFHSLIQQNPQIDLENTVFVIKAPGQSNAIGRATASRVYQLTKYREIPDDVKIYYKPDYTSADNGAFFTVQQGTTLTREPDQAAIAFTGDYVMLAENLKRVSPNTVYIIPEGDGGTALKQNLTTPDWYEGSTGECFQIFTEYYYSVAYSKIVAENPGKTIITVILWHQGESDAADATATSQYSTNFSGAGRFIESLRASHSSLSNALLIITKLYYNVDANEATINAFFQSYADANSGLVKIVDISDQRRKQDLSTWEKGGIATAGADDQHTAYTGQITKAEREYAHIKSRYFPLIDDSDMSSYTAFDPSSLGTTGFRLQLTGGKVDTTDYSVITAIDNDFSIGSFSTITNSPRWKAIGRSGGMSFLVSSNARVRTSAAVGSSLIDGSFSFAGWIKPRDGQTASDQYIFHDIQTTVTPNNSRCGFYIQSTGKVVAFIGVGGTTISALTNSVIFQDGVQLKEKHIAVTFTQGGLIRIYIDGVLQTLDAVSNGNIAALTLSNYVNATNPFTIGARLVTQPSTFDLPFTGTIRGDLIWHTGVVYSQTDIDNLMLNKYN